MKCKHDRAPANATFCPDCGMKLITLRGEIKVPAPKQRGATFWAQITVAGERVYISADSEEEYYTKARAAKQGLIECKKAAPGMTLGTAIDNYINDNDAVLSPSTINAYKSYRRTRFMGYMDDDLEQINYQRMVNEECRKVSPKTVHNAFRLVTASLKHAGIPVPQINLPQKRKSERPWLDYQQIQAFTSALRGKPYELGALLALNGLRRSEILHLTTDDVDADKGLIFVRGASVVGPTNKIVDKGTNKNTASTRTVHIVIPRLNYIISEIKEEIDEGDDAIKLVTTNPTTLYGLINGLCRREGLPEVGVHGLRHSYISLCFHLGWDMQTVMQQGGYSNPQVVNEVYRHLAAQDASDDIKRMKDFYSSANRQFFCQ